MPWRDFCSNKKKNRKEKKIKLFCYILWIYLSRHKKYKSLQCLLLNCRGRNGRLVGGSSLVQKEQYKCSFPFCSSWLIFFACRFTICHKTEVIKNTLNPVWQSFTIPVRALCNGDYDRSENMIKFNIEVFYDYLETFRDLPCSKLLVFSG